ncbi:MAG: efflux RND transporter periplasmic adaptor subunit [Pseudomonadota bacterium]
MRLFPILLAALVAIGFYFLVIDRSWTQAASPDPSETEEIEATEEDPDSLIRVVVQRSQAQNINSAVILRGQTQAARTVEIRAETSATVLSEPLRKGAFVEAGDIMCQLEPGTRPAVLAEARAKLIEARAMRIEADSRIPEARARLAEAQAGLAEARVNENAAARLSEDGFASETRLKNAQAAVASAEAAVETANAGLIASQSGIQAGEAGIETAAAAVAAAQKEIERLEIRAPFSGLLETDTAELGSLLQQGSLCATVLQLDPIKLVAFVPETEVNRVEVDAPVGARLAAGGDQLQGNVTFLSRSADETTRTFRVEISIPNPNLRIRDGQTAEIVIGSEGAPAHLLPASALTLNDDGTLGIRAVDENSQVVFQPVTLLRDTTEGVWLSGLPDDVNVVVVGQEYVTEGIKVAATFREQTQ